MHSTRSRSDEVYQLLAHGRWFSPASSTTKTGRHDIAEILLKVALNTKNQSIIQPTPRYSWNTAKIVVRHQSINQSINFVGISFHGLTDNQMFACIWIKYLWYLINFLVTYPCGLMVTTKITKTSTRLTNMNSQWI